MRDDTREWAKDTIRQIQGDLDDASAGMQCGQLLRSIAVLEGARGMLHRMIGRLLANRSPVRFADDGNDPDEGVARDEPPTPYIDVR